MEPLADTIGRHVRQGPALFADDTPVKMLSPGNKRTKTARAWAYVRDERPWNGQAPPCARYQFTIDRKGDHPVSHLSGYRGWVHADGYSGFNGLFGENKASEMACMAHIRRKFVDGQQSQGSAIAEETIKRIAPGSALETPFRAMMEVSIQFIVFPCRGFRTVFLAAELAAPSRRMKRPASGPCG